MLTNLITPDSLDTQITVAQHAFSIMADMNVFPAVSADVIIKGDASQTFTAIVRYTGGVRGSIQIECAPSVAYAFTERIMGITPAPDAFDANVSDAIGELINIIGGNLKGLLPPNTSLNMPEVFEALLAEDEGSLGLRLSCLNFESDFGSFRLVLRDTP